jgi:hypothetical protein
VGGNEAVSKAGETLFRAMRIGGQRQEFMAPVASILSTEGVLRRMTRPPHVASLSRPAGGPPRRSTTRASTCI